MPFIVKGIFSDPDYTIEQKSKLIAILRTGKNPTTEEFNGAYETMKKLNNKYRRNLDFRRYDQIKKSMK